MMAALLAGLLTACPDDGYKDPPTGNDGGIDAEIQDAMTIVDVPDLPDRIINPEGPDIIIDSPQPMAVLSGSQTEVVATVIDEDGVNVSSVRAVIPGGSTFTLSRSGTVDNQYSGIIDLTEIPTAASMFLFVEAADILDNWNSALGEVVRDQGPTVDFISPVEGERYAGSVNLTFQVNDVGGVLESSVRAEVGSVPLDIVKLSEDPNHGSAPHWIIFGGEIVFDDPMFVPPLQSIQQVTVTAENIANNVQSESAVTFVVDDEGPVITVLSPEPGEIVGGIITIEAEVYDEAGVLNTSVVAVLGNNNDYTVELLPFGGTFSGSFDTTQFPTNYVFPPISVRAADALNNESEVGFVVALDNTPPIVSLDPPENMRMGKDELGFIMCSFAFDPVGDANPDDGTTVPQVHFMRARIEDQGNAAVGLLQVPLSLVNYTTPRVYWLTDTSQALVVDTDGDTYCDEINPELIPSTNPQGANEILALYLDPIEPAGSADFRPDLSVLPEICDGPGIDAVAPEELCVVTRPELMTIAIFYTVDDTEPAIWSLPQVMGNDPLFCTGHQFDNFASNIPEGWVCVAGRAEDNAGNIGVSKPIRLCVDYTLDGNPATCGNPGDMPDCTGTLDPQTQTVDPAVPCMFDPDKQLFSDDQVRILL
jgi:hypothetical protein